MRGRRIAEEFLSIASEPSSTSWADCPYPRSFPLSHAFVTTLITQFDHGLPLNLYYGSLLNSRGQDHVQPCSPPCPSLLEICDLLTIGKNQPAAVPQLHVPAFCKGPPWTLVKCNLDGFGVITWYGWDGLSVLGLVRLISKSALHIDINIAVGFCLVHMLFCAYVGYGYFFFSASVFELIFSLSGCSWK